MAIEDFEPTSIESHIRLWGRAGGCCSLQNCRKELLPEVQFKASTTPFCNACYIKGWGDDHARYDGMSSRFNPTQYDNQILLCESHYSQVLNPEAEYTVKQLDEEKSIHENFIANQPNFDDRKLEENEAYGTYFDRWRHLAHVDNWCEWATDVLKYPTCSIHIELFENLLVLNAEMASWELKIPTRYLEILPAFDNFQSKLNRLLELFFEYRERSKDHSSYVIKKPIPKPYDSSQSMDYNIWVSNSNHPGEALDEVIVDLTKSANHIIDLGTQHLLPSLRKIIGELKLIETVGEDNSQVEISPRYSIAEKEEIYADWLNADRTNKLFKGDYS